MKLDHAGVVLYIEPMNEPRKSSISEYRWLEKLMKNAKHGIYDKTSKQFIENALFNGIHTCSCGAQSKDYDLLLPNGMVTNTLCMHYLEFHQAEIPKKEFKKLKHLKTLDPIHPIEQDDFTVVEIIQPMCILL